MREFFFIFNIHKVLKERSRIRIHLSVGSGSISQGYGSGDSDPHQNVTDPQHWNSPQVPAGAG
jgi:hypothetical protein